MSNVIAEATFHGDDADLLRGWGSRFGAEVVCVICRADAALRRTRIRSRQRRRAHAEADRLQLETVGAEEVDYSRLPGRHIDVATRAPLEACIAAVLVQLA